MSTKIGWCDETWNAITGCHKISPACDNCYAEKMAKRLGGRFGYPKDNPFQVTFHPDKLEEPFKWKKPRKIFVTSMGDLFHEDVQDSWLDLVFQTMVQCHPMGHKFLLLTKRPENILNNPNTMRLLQQNLHRNFIWVGVTVENQAMADKRIPLLLQVPAAIRFISVEPMLGPINIRPRYLPNLDENTEITDDSNNNGCTIDWVICGGESGNRARPMHPDWVRSLRDQSLTARVPFFFKQWGTYTWKAGQPVKVGKKHSGRHLDGWRWTQFPV